MPRRRSARIAGGKAAKGNDGPALNAVAEGDEPMNMASPLPQKSEVPQTPADSSPAKAGWSEMHPSKVHVSMGPPSSALRLGFSDIPKNGKDNKLASPTPANVNNGEFNFAAPHPNADMGLSSDAQRMMFELRDKAKKIKADLVAKKQLEDDVMEDGVEKDAITGRKMAQARGKASRFSAAHIAEFKKMDSIANHPSAFRVQPGGGKLTPLAASASSRGGLKRSPSKANLDDYEPAASTGSGPFTSINNGYSSNGYTNKRDAPGASAAAAKPTPGSKRVRQLLTDDASSSRPGSRDGASGIPRPKSSGKDVVGTGGGAIPRSHSSLASLMSPTKASLARTATNSVATPKPPVPSFATSTKGSFIPEPKSVGGGGLAKSQTMGNLALFAGRPDEVGSKTPVASPGRFERVRNMFRGKSGKQTAAVHQQAANIDDANAHAGADLGKTAAPSEPGFRFAAGGVNGNGPAPFATPKPAARPAASVRGPLTTPGRRLQKRPMAYGSPSPAKKEQPSQGYGGFGQSPAAAFARGKSGIPRSPSKRDALGDITAAAYPSLDTVMEQGEGKKKPTKRDAKDVNVFTANGSGLVRYPDLSAHRHLLDRNDEVAGKLASPQKAADVHAPMQLQLPTAAQMSSAAAPGSFTFRADHTIDFAGASPKGFGSSPGQASVRHVRPSINPGQHMGNHEDTPRRGGYSDFRNHGDDDDPFGHLGRTRSQNAKQKGRNTAAGIGNMPGSFPSSRLSVFGPSAASLFPSNRLSNSSNKENVGPAVDDKDELDAMDFLPAKKDLSMSPSKIPGAAKHRFMQPAIAHGLANKKRHRAVAWDEDEEGDDEVEQEGAARAAKKKKALPETYGEHVAAANTALDVDDAVVLLPKPLMKYGSAYLIEKHRRANQRPPTRKPLPIAAPAVAATPTSIPAPAATPSARKPAGPSAAATPATTTTTTTAASAARRQPAKPSPPLTMVTRRAAALAQESDAAKSPLAGQDAANNNGGSSSTRRRPVLSLSRLNVLARPKARR